MTYYLLPMGNKYQKKVHKQNVSENLIGEILLDLLFKFALLTGGS